MPKVYRIQVSVEISDQQRYNPLRLSESMDIELETLSDAAKILVKLHEFFEELKKRKEKS